MGINPLYTWEVRKRKSKTPRHRRSRSQGTGQEEEYIDGDTLARDRQRELLPLRNQPTQLPSVQKGTYFNKQSKRLAQIKRGQGPGGVRSRDRTAILKHQRECVPSEGDASRDGQRAAWSERSSGGQSCTILRFCGYLSCAKTAHWV